jgi:ubiquinol-cytochrome c reductase cytochrome c subunit
MLAALALAGGVFTVLAPPSSAEESTPALSEQARRGKALFDTSCVSCHGRRAEGVDGRAPSLVGVGSAAVEFQVGTGRMPAANSQPEPPRKPSTFTDEETRQLGQYVQELGGGPQLPPGNRLRAGGTAAVATGGELYRVNCASCHAWSGGGGALTSGKYAPSLDRSTDRQIYAAMLTGPQNMPVFGDNQLSPEQKSQIIAYIQQLKADKDPGGYGLGRYGPVPEGLAIFLVGVVALIFATIWIAGKS